MKPTFIFMMLLVMFSLTFAACDSRPNLDFSTDEAAVLSIEAISEKLTPKDQKRFKAAMSKVVTRITNEAIAESANMVEAYPIIKDRIYESLHDKTADEVIALGETK